MERGYRPSARGRAHLERTAGGFDDVRAHCLSRPGAVEEHPFGPGALVVKVGGRIFAIIGEDGDPATVSLKCDPDEAAALRDAYAAVAPGYHLDKRHWITVTLDDTVPAADVRAWIDDSYDLVVDKLPRAVRELLGRGDG